MYSDICVQILSRSDRYSHHCSRQFVAVGRRTEFKLVVILPIAESDTNMSILEWHAWPSTSDNILHNTYPEFESSSSGVFQISEKTTCSIISY